MMSMKLKQSDPSAVSEQGAKRQRDNLSERLGNTMTHALIKIGLLEIRQMARGKKLLVILLLLLAVAALALVVRLNAEPPRRGGWPVRYLIITTFVSYSQTAISTASFGLLSSKKIRAQLRPTTISATGMFRATASPSSHTERLPNNCTVAL